MAGLARCSSCNYHGMTEWIYVRKGIHASVHPACNSHGEHKSKLLLLVKTFPFLLN